jgi:hypothetical protein
MLRTTQLIYIFLVLLPASRQIRCNITNCWRKTVHAWSHQVLKNAGESVCENEQMALLSYQAAISNAARGAICRLSEDLFNVMFAPGSSAQDLKAPCQRSATKQAPRMLLSQINVLSRYTHTLTFIYKV